MGHVRVDGGRSGHGRVKRGGAVILRAASTWLLYFLVS
jgi:hypothetical protein